MTAFEHVAVLMGGTSAERDVSLRTGQAVVAALRAAGYRVSAVDVTAERLDLPEAVDAVFIALHGTFGEDGQVQALLYEAGVPYAGSGPAASRTAFDKCASKELFIAQDLPTPAYEVLRAPAARTLPLPVVVKPARQGSSFGIHRVFREADWPAAYADAASYDEQVLVEAYIAGRELTVGVVGDDVLPVLEICAPDGNYDYHAKYTAGVTTYHVPADLPPAQAAACQELARRAFRALGCEGFGRVDFRMAPDGTAYILEVNTIPGCTATSLLPKAAQAAGIAFPELCDRIIRTASVH